MEKAALIAPFGDPRFPWIREILAMAPLCVSMPCAGENGSRPMKLGHSGRFGPCQVIKPLTKQNHGRIVGGHELTRHEGGCLCGGIRYATLAQPSRVTVCHCRFCQKATGSAYMVEPIFEADNFAIASGIPKVFDQVSAGSGKAVHVHFCPECGTKLWLSFERFPDAVGVYAGTFDDPCWFPIKPATSKHIFLGVARPDTVIPAGLPTYMEHATTNDGTPQEATVFDACHQMGRS